MKRMFSLLLSLALLLGLAACGSNSTPASLQNGYADPDAFLQDMAEGIRQRLADSLDTEEMSAGEEAAHLEALVQYELDRIEKYQKLRFSDETFDQLAHLYISACQTQRFAAQNYKNQSLYSTLWDGGKEIRCGVIMEFYTRYDLPITDNEAANYQPDASGSSSSATVTAEMDGYLDIASGLTLYSDQMVTYDEVIRIDEDAGQVLYDDEDIMISLKSLELTDGNYQVNFLIDNKREAERATCELGRGYVDDYKVDFCIPWGYTFVDPGKKGDTFSYVSNTDLEAIGMETFETLSCYFYVLVSDGETGQYLAKIPMEIAREAFHP